MKKRTQAQIKSLISDFRKSGQSQAKFCRENSLSLSTFNSWLRKNRDVVAAKPESNFSFVEVMEESGFALPSIRTLRISTSYGLLLEIPL
jgi:hypothetical protein